MLFSIMFLEYYLNKTQFYVVCFIFFIYFNFKMAKYDLLQYVSGE